MFFSQVVVRGETTVTDERRNEHALNDNKNVVWVRGVCMEPPPPLPQALLAAPAHQRHSRAFSRAQPPRKGNFKYERHDTVELVVLKQG